MQIDLIIRGICCLRPGMPGVSDNIRVISIVDKYLEHSRISYFQNGDEPEVFLASADWMPRNFRRRVEIMFPIEDPQLKRRLVDGILGVVLADNVKARELQADGTYRRVAPAKPGEPSIRSQVEFQNMALELCETSPISHAAAAVGGVDDQLISLPSSSISPRNSRGGASQLTVVQVLSRPPSA